MKRFVSVFMVLFFFAFAAFSQKTISVDEAMKLVKDVKNLQIVDVRTKVEFDSAYVVNAINVDFRNPNFATNILVIDKNQPVLVYCRSGKRSLNAMNSMVSAGFQEVYNMQGGILAFKKKYSSYLKSNLN